MNFRIAITSFLSVLMIAFSGPASAGEDGLSLLQKDEVESIIEDYLVENPEILVRAMEAYRAKQQRADTALQARILAGMDTELRNNPTSPVGGNPNGDLTIVEFFDYRCPYCKQVLPMIKKLLETDKGIRYVFKELPILGPDSIVASRAAVAVWINAPEKYNEFHIAMMGGRGKITAKKVFIQAKKIGIKADDLRKWMADNAVDTEIALNARLARELGITGTPAFIIGSQVIPGAIDEPTLLQLVAEARQANK
ncbi:MAG: DsbA family protein [Alphaproteobacteria bacterium]